MHYSQRGKGIPQSLGRYNGFHDLPLAWSHADGMQPTQAGADEATETSRHIEFEQNVSNIKVLVMGQKKF